MVLDEVDHECSDTSPEDEILSVVYASELESKTPPPFLQPPLSLTTVEETSDMASDFQSYLPSDAIPVELMGLPCVDKNIKLLEFYGFNPQQKAKLYFNIHGNPFLHRITQMSESITRDGFQFDVLQRCNGFEIQHFVSRKSH